MGAPGTDPELQIRIRADGSQAKQEIAGVRSEAAKLSDDQLNQLKQSGPPVYLETLRKAAEENKKAAAESASELREAKRAAGDVAQAFDGLRNASQGGAQGMLGLVQAGRAALGLFRQVGTVLLGPVGLGLGAAAAGIAYLGKIASENQEKIEEIFSDSAQRAAQLKKATDELGAQEEKTFKRYETDIAAVVKEYDELLGRMDAASKRFEETQRLQSQLAHAVIDRDEQSALAKAKTDEERQAISQKFAAKRTALGDKEANNDLENLRLSGELQRRNATDQAQALQGKLNEASSEAEQKKSAAQGATAIARQALDKYGAGAVVTLDAQAAAKEAQASAKSATAKLNELTQQVAEAMKTIDAQIDEANAKIEKAKIGAEIRSVQVQTDALKTSNEAAPKIAKLEAESRAALNSQNFAAQDEANKERATIVGTVKAAAARAATNEDQLSTVTDPNGAPLQRPTASIAPVVKAISDQTHYIRAGSAELVAAQQENARVMIEFQTRLKAAQEKTARQIKNARE